MELGMWPVGSGGGHGGEFSEGEFGRELKRVVGCRRGGG